MRMLVGVCNSVPFAGEAIKRWLAYKEALNFQREYGLGTQASVVNAFNAATNPDSETKSSVKAASYRNVLNTLRIYDMKNPQKIEGLLVDVLRGLNNKIKDAVFRSRVKGDDVDALLKTQDELHLFSQSHMDRVAQRTFIDVVAPPIPMEPNAMAMFAIKMWDAADANNGLFELNAKGNREITSNLGFERMRLLSMKLDSMQEAIAQYPALKGQDGFVENRISAIKERFKWTTVLVSRNNEDTLRTAWHGMFDAMKDDGPASKGNLRKDVEALDKFQRDINIFSAKGTPTKGSVFIVDHFHDIVKRYQQYFEPNSPEGLRLEKMDKVAFNFLDVNASTLTRNAVQQFDQPNTNDNSYGQLMSNTIAVRDTAHLQSIAKKVSPEATQHSELTKRISDRLAEIKSTHALGVDESTAAQIENLGNPKEILSAEIAIAARVVETMEKGEYEQEPSLAIS